MHALRSKTVMATGIAASLLAGCTASHVAPVNPIPLDQLMSQSRPLMSSPYTISADDDITVRLYYHPELDEDLRVRPDGKIELSLVGETQAAGKTPQQLADALSTGYAKFFTRPNTSVIVRHINNLRAFVGGEVAHPGIVDLQAGKMTVAQSIAATGGATNDASLKDVILIRRLPDRAPMVASLDLRAAISGRDTREDPYLYANDLVYVPRSDLADINLLVRQLILNNLGLTTSAGVTWFKPLP